MSSYHYSNLEAEDYNLLVVDIDKGYIDTAAPEEQSKVWGGAEDHRIASIFGRINYNYDEKYLFEAVVRRTVRQTSVASTNMLHSPGFFGLGVDS